LKFGRYRSYFIVSEIQTHNAEERQDYYAEFRRITNLNEEKIKTSNLYANREGWYQGTSGFGEGLVGSKAVCSAGASGSGTGAPARRWVTGEFE